MAFLYSFRIAASCSREITLTDDDYKMIAKSTTVQALDLSSVKTTDAGLKIIATIPQLESIHVKGR